MTQSTHPAPEQLASFVRGELTPGELDEVAEHIRGCDSCCVAVQRARAETHIVATPGPAGGQSAQLAPEVTPKEEPLPLKVPPALLDHPQYQIIGQLGEGGMGVVYKAEHRMMGRVVALKVIAPKLTSKANVVARFVKEVKAAARLAHPNIVTAHDAGEAGGLHFLVMEFVEGISLDRFVARRGGTLPVALACQFARQAALGLQHAHEKGMVHRDIKPANLMVTRKGQIKILDFGLARLVQDENEGGGPAATAANLVMGTPDYLSPEQARNSHTVDIRADIYSLGCTLYYLLTGHVAFPNATTLIEKLLAHTREKPQPVQESRLDVPDALVAVLAKMMAKRPDDRYSTPAEAAAALAPFARGPGLGAVTDPGMSGALGPRPNSMGASQSAPLELVDAELVALPTVPTSGPQTKPLRKADPEFSQEGPTRSTVRKKKSRPSVRKPRWGLWVALVTIVVGGMAMGAMVRFITLKSHAPTEVADSTPKSLVQAPPNEEKAPPPQPSKSSAHPTGKQESTAPTPPTPPPLPRIPPGESPFRGGKKLLFILPHKGLAFNDYELVRIAVEKQGLKSVTAAPIKAGTASLFVDKNDKNDKKDKKENLVPAKPVDIQLILTESVDLTEFGGVVFCGHDVGEYVGDSREARIVKSIILRMIEANRYVIGVGLGQRILVEHEFLRGKRAAGNGALFLRYPPEKSGIDWHLKTEGPIKSDQIVTIGHPDTQATQLAALLLMPPPGKK